MADGVAVAGVLLGGFGLGLAAFDTITQRRTRAAVSRLEAARRHDELEPKIAATWEFDVEGWSEFLRVTNDGPLDLTSISIDLLPGSAGWQPVCFDAPGVEALFQSRDGLRIGHSTFVPLRRADVLGNGGRIRLRITCGAGADTWTLAREVKIPNAPR